MKSGGAARPGVVLVVDDDRDAREALTEILQRAGYSVVQAQDGVEALARARSERPFLIILDLVMPSMNGWEFRRAQLADADIAKLPVVISSASIAHLDALRPAAVLPKPFDAKRLLETVERHSG